jgi:hypothetical protein
MRSRLPPRLLPRLAGTSLAGISDSCTGALDECAAAGHE